MEGRGSSRVRGKNSSKKKTTMTRRKKDQKKRTRKAACDLVQKKGKNEGRRPDCRDEPEKPPGRRKVSETNTSSAKMEEKR